jgi:hypothetical protein
MVVIEDDDGKIEDTRGKRTLHYMKNNNIKFAIFNWE